MDQTNTNALQTFEQFLSTQNVKISVLAFIINLLLAAVLSFILSRLYIRHGSSLSNRKAFAGNFVLIAATTMIIITIVKSSLALSLGLVGALSIVRFRAAIKEPEELSYIFLTIAIGLGLGADQRLITIVGFLMVVGFILLKNFNRKKTEYENLLLTISTTAPKEDTLEKVIALLEQHCSGIDLKRFDENSHLSEISLLVEYKDLDSFNKSKAALKQMDPSMAISFIDNKGMI
ncbi:MAG: DUF4956 domain-containing protein [Saprospiraceae bacterium]|nr:DUF4956 domain-containing protein [Saprospiraceae bacterium]MCB0624110.1 DUF4956 domain-containing protein [Saprospiraceae bacterium]MCB0677547.1 DUF4956 domain-containing protein [Saprospiraceae bacterium]MCB0679821.1 DUF4956 domain-containing protein [Saprospiraceae bacterium]